MENNSRVAPHLFWTFALQLQGIVLGIGEHFADRGAVAVIECPFDLLEFFYQQDCIHRGPQFSP